MSKFTIDGGEGPKTQSPDAVKSMIEFFDGKACEKLPAKVQLTGGWMLVLSSKRDQYYVTSAKECSCPGFSYRRRCKHVAALRDAEQKALVEKEHLTPSQQLARNIVEAMES